MNTFPEIHKIESIDLLDSYLDNRSVIDKSGLKSIPVEHKGKLVACLSKQQISESTSISDFIVMGEKFCSEESNFTDLWNYFCEYQLDQIPITDKEGKYIGSILSDDLIHWFTWQFSIDESKVVIVLEIKSEDYSLAKIARIGEEYNETIKYSYIIKHHKKDSLFVTLVFNNSNIDAILSDFERNDFIVLRVLGKSQDQDSWNEKIEEFIHYLNL